MATYSTLIDLLNAVVNGTSSFATTGGGTGGSGSNAAASLTGAAVPTSADYTGFNSGGNLVGVSTANPLPVAQVGTVTIAYTQQALVAGSALIGKVGIDQTTPGTTNGVQINAALPAGTNVIGHVIVDTAPTTAVTGPLTDTQLRATAVPVSLASTTVTNFPATQAVSGTVAATQSGTWTVQPGNTANTTAWKVDGSAVTQPVSGTVTAAQATAASLNATVVQATPASLQVTATPITLSKGTQGATGFSVQNLTDAGRNQTNYFMALPIVTTTTDALVSLTGYKSGAAVGATTTPAVVTSGKTYRILSVHLTYVAIATAGTCKFTLRANTGGVVAITSPAVTNWVVGGTAATAGISQSVIVDFPDGIEFAAGTGIGISIVGLGATQAAAAVGYGLAAIHGFEY